MTQNIPDPDARQIFDRLVTSMRETLGGELVALYLDGSLTNGDFDVDSDIDFVAVTRGEIPEATFQALQEMHDRIAALDSIWAIQLEGSYLSARAVRRFDPAYVLYPNIERGRGERLKLARHAAAWDIHRWVLRERGITVLGPDPRELVDPVPPARLREVMRPALFEWAQRLLDDPGLLRMRGYQTYIVLTMCRVLYTSANGAVASKPAAARWAKQHLDPRWWGLIDRTWEGRHNPDTPAAPDEIQATLDFIRYAQEAYRGIESRE